MAAAVVWCRSCKTAVWAYDDLRSGQDVRGLCNMLQLPCPKCGTVGNFDGWDGDDLDYLIEHATEAEHPVYDWWSALKAVFLTNCKDGLWEISPDCTWFKRPNHPTGQYKTLIKGIVHQIEVHRPGPLNCDLRCDGCKMDVPGGCRELKEPQ